MFRSTLINAFLLSGTLFAQIPNNSFENWSPVANYEIPDSWSSMNHTTASYSIFTATKASPGNPGNAYLKLTSKTVGNTVINGVAVCGKLDTLTLAPKSGFAFNQRPAALSGKWQHMIYGNSQGSVMALLTKWNSVLSKRDTVAYAKTTLSGMAMSWANFSINLLYMDSLHFPDSCIIALKASGSIPANNDYLWVDNLAFTGTVSVAAPVDPVGINSESPESYLPLIYPNPVKYNLNLITRPNYVIKYITLHNSLGEQVFFMESPDDPVKFIDISELKPGIYWLRISDGKTVMNKKVIKE